MEEWDIIIAGGGSSGCVLASRLSADPRLRVLLVEAGPLDKHPLIHLPKGMARLLGNPDYSYSYDTERLHAGQRSTEVLLRGRGLGGTSNINGMVYHRGQAADYDDWEAMGLAGWGWKDVLPSFLAIENNPLPANQWRGRNGPVTLQIANQLPRLAETIIAAAGDLGVPKKDDPNTPDQFGIAPAAHNIDTRGRRMSAATAFLTPEVRRRSNLRILPNSRIEKILFEGQRATGVRCDCDGQPRTFRATREIVLSVGTLESPRLLQISGIGSPDHLRQLGIDVIANRAGVGSNFRDHFCYNSSWRLREQLDSENREYRGWRLIGNALVYGLTRGGPLSTGAAQMTLFADMLGMGRADAEILYNPYSLAALAAQGDAIRTEDEPGCSFHGFAARGTSEGSVVARSADPREPAKIQPNYLATDYDRSVTVALVRFLGRLMTHPRLTSLVAGEVGTSSTLESDDEILNYVLATGNSAGHSIGTCKMGTVADPLSVVDEQLRVRGVDGLRVADCSIMPTQVSANTNGSAMMIGWRAADFIQASLACS